MLFVQLWKNYNLYIELFKATILDAKKNLKNLEFEKLKEDSDKKLEGESTLDKNQTKKLKTEENSTSNKKSKKL